MQDSPKHDPDLALDAGTIRTSQPLRTPDDELLHQRMLDRLRAGKDVRDKLAEQVAQSIKGGGYDNDLKFDIALDRMIDDACNDLTPHRQYGRRATDLPGRNQVSNAVC